jgi:hypothetical protein
MTMLPLTIVRWNEIIEYLWNQPAGSVLRIPAIKTEHPRAGGLSLTLGLPVGQRANYGTWFTDGSVLAVTDFGTHYDVTMHRAVAPPPPTPRVEPFLQHSPGASVLGLTALGALVGLAFGRSEEGALTGALIGGTAGLAAVAVGNAGVAPETSKQAADLIAAFGRALAESKARRESPQRSPRAAAHVQGSAKRPKALPSAARPTKLGTR